jgi:hypothetical protein
MKKYLLPIILSLMLLAVPVTADAPYRLVVDGVAVDKPVVIIDGVSYAPIRAVADIFGATTEWYGTTNTINIIKHTKIERPPIEGDEEFVEKINAALDLLEEKDFPHYVMVCQYTFDIAPLLIDNPADEVKDLLAFNTFCSTRIMPRLINNPKMYEPVFLAGILVHEACHATTTKYGKPITEKDAYAHELAAFKALDAPQWMQNECLGGE